MSRIPDIISSTLIKTSATKTNLWWNPSVNWTRTRRMKSRAPGCQSTPSTTKSEIFMANSAGQQTFHRSTQRITTKCIRHIASFSTLHATMPASTTIKTWLMLSSSEKMHQKCQSHASPSLQSSLIGRSNQWARLSSAKQKIQRTRVSSHRGEVLSLQTLNRSLAAHSTIHLSSCKRNPVTNSEMKKSSSKQHNLIRAYPSSANH